MAAIAPYTPPAYTAWETDTSPIASKVLLRSNISVVNGDDGTATWIYYQQDDGSISVAWKTAGIDLDEAWKGGDDTKILESGKAMMHTPLATIMWRQQAQFEYRTYYLDSSFKVREIALTPSKDASTWRTGTLDNADFRAAPYSQLSAICWLSKGLPQIRIYYQGTDDLIHEICFGGGDYTTGATLPGTPLRGTSLSFVNRSPSQTPSIRGYFQSHNLHLQEIIWEVGGWHTPGDLVSGPIPFRTAIVNCVPRGSPDALIRVHWLDVNNDIAEVWKHSTTSIEGWIGPGTWTNAKGFDGAKMASVSFYRGDTADADCRVYIQGHHGNWREVHCVKGTWGTAEQLKDVPIATIPVN